MKSVRNKYANDSLFKPLIAYFEKYDIPFEINSFLESDKRGYIKVYYFMLIDNETVYMNGKVGDSLDIFKLLDIAYRCCAKLEYPRRLKNILEQNGVYYE